MPVPKRRTGKTRKNMRRSHHAMTAPTMTSCQSCGERVQTHRVCPKCGYYKVRTVLNSDQD